jgi:hypothetical protein
MADSRERKDARDVGSDSPARGSAKKQNIEGERGGPREAQTPPRTEKQPPQASGRRSRKHEHAPQQRKSFGPGEDPAEQGDGEPRPHQVKQESGMQGAAGGSGAGGRAAGTEDKQADAEGGEPQSEHTRAGRQKSPGDRDPQQD